MILIHPFCFDIRIALRRLILKVKYFTIHLDSMTEISVWYFFFWVTCFYFRIHGLGCIHLRMRDEWHTLLYPFFLLFSRIHVLVINTVPLCISLHLLFLLHSSVTDVFQYFPTTKLFPISSKTLSLFPIFSVYLLLESKFKSTFKPDFLALIFFDLHSTVNVKFKLLKLLVIFFKRVSIILMW